MISETLHEVVWERIQSGLGIDEIVLDPEYMQQLVQSDVMTRSDEAGNVFYRGFRVRAGGQGEITILG